MHRIHNPNTHLHLASTILITFRNSWGYMFTNDAGTYPLYHLSSRAYVYLQHTTDVIVLVSTVLPLCAAYQIFDGIQAVSSGVMRACGKQSIAAVVYLTGYYVVGIPCGMYLTFGRHYGLSGLWLGLELAIVYTAAVGGSICARMRWREEAIRVAARIKADKNRLLDEEAN
jgi:multidrug resistance protein, MATE family